MAINLNIGQKIMVGRLGNQAIKIDDMTVSRKHCTIRRVSQTEYEIEDVGSARGTIANGIPVAKMKVSADTPLMLGNFQTTVNALLGIQVKPQGAQSASGASQGNNAGKTIHIAKLDEIYEAYQDAIKSLNKRKGTANVKRMLPMQIGMPVVMCAGMFLNNMMDDKMLANVLKGVLMIGCISLAVVFSTNNASDSESMVEEQFDLNKQFQIDYVCPECKNFLGMSRPVRLLIKMGQCPYCKGTFVY